MFTKCWMFRRHGPAGPYDHSIALRPGSRASVAFCKLWEQAKRMKEGRASMDVAGADDVAGLEVWAKDVQVALLPRPSKLNHAFTGTGNSTHSTNCRLGFMPLCF